MIVRIDSGGLVELAIMFDWLLLLLLLLFVFTFWGCLINNDLIKVGNLVVMGWGGGGAVVIEVFTVASVNIIQSRFTIRSTNNTMVVITRIKLVTSRLPLKLKITLVVMVLRFYWQC
jgi:hypothetical protein